MMGLFKKKRQGFLFWYVWLIYKHPEENLYYAEQIEWEFNEPLHYEHAQYELNCWAENTPYVLSANPYPKGIKAMTFTVVGDSSGTK